MGMLRLRAGGMGKLRGGVEVCCTRGRLYNGSVGMGEVRGWGSVQVRNRRQEGNVFGLGDALTRETRQSHGGFIEEVIKLVQKLLPRSFDLINPITTDSAACQARKKVNT